MIEYSKFDPATGMILRFGLCQDEVFHAESNVIEGAFDDSKYYVVDHAPVERPRLDLPTYEILADGVDELVIVGLPVPCIISVDDEDYEITDELFEFSTTIPGEYRLQAKTFPYTDEVFTFNAL